MSSTSRKEDPEEAPGTDGLQTPAVEEKAPQPGDDGGMTEETKVMTGRTDPREPPIGSAGEFVGRYKLLQNIGEGGFGTVWMAEQTEPIKRRVALKIIKPGMDTREVIARFEAERQALAMMDHPHIARVLDAGATRGGRPYFVMELVRGLPVTTFCDEAKLSTRERLELFSDICSAINHAHQKGIIHRDIKPSNVLVTLHADKPVPKVIDFGIAKATQQALTEKTLFTLHGAFIGTPVYMSPEQAALSAIDIDTRSDIYGLGVLLYELLTGWPPFDSRALASAGYDEMRRIIREQEPPRPSTRLGTATAPEQHTLAASHRTDPAKLARLVRGDLDWIVMKAIEKDRTRRYETANAFAADIRRFLRDEPVLATPPSAAYRFRKFARRHKAGLGIAVLIAVILMAATGISLWQAGVARSAMATALKAENKALEKAAGEKAAREESDAINTYLTEVFQSPDPTLNGRKITVAETLDRAVKRLDADLAGQPERRAALQLALGRTYRVLGLHGEAVPLLVKSRAYFLAVHGTTHSRTIESTDGLAAALFNSGRSDEGLSLFQEALRLSQEANGALHTVTLRIRNNLGTAYYKGGRDAEALKLREETLKLCLSATGAEEVASRPYAFTAMRDLATSLDREGRMREAIPLFETVLHARRDALPREHPDVLSSMSDLATAYFKGERWNDALRIRQDILPLITAVYGPDDPKTLDAKSSLAESHGADGQHSMALKLREEVVAQWTQKNPERPETLEAVICLASSLQEVGRPGEAIARMEQALPVVRKVAVPKEGLFTRALTCLALLYGAEGRAGEALPLLKEVLGILLKVPQPDPAVVSAAMDNVATGLWFTGSRKEAFAQWEEALAFCRKASLMEEPRTLRMMSRMEGAYSEDSQPDKLLALRKEIVPHLRNAFGDKDIRTLQSIEALADSLDDAGESGEALRWRNEWQALRGYLPPVRETLVPPDSQWKWLHPVDGKDPESATPGFQKSFFLSTFNDSGWTPGRDSDDPDKGFGYGRAFAGVDIGKPVDEAHRHTAYFRHPFTTDRRHTGLELRCRFDDGIIVYLDGREILRDNVASGPDVYLLEAGEAVSGVDETMLRRFPVPGALAAGAHMLAISVHNATPPSSDLRLGGVTLVELAQETPVK